MGVGLRPGAKAAGRATDPLPATRLPSTLHEWCRYPDSGVDEVVESVNSINIAVAPGRERRGQGLPDLGGRGADGGGRRGAAAVDLLPHVPVDGNHGVSVGQR